MPYKSIINPNPTGNNNILVSLYNYVPKLSFNIIATVLFGILFFYFTFKAFRFLDTRLVYAWLMFGCLLETISYILRSVGHKKPYHAGIYTGQYVLNIVAPNAFITAFQLALFRHLRQRTQTGTPTFVYTKATMLRTLFMVLNAITAVWQIVGAAMIGVSERKLVQGQRSSFSTYQANRVLLSGLAFQLAHNLAFQAIVTVLLLKSFKKPRVGTTGTTTADQTTAYATSPVAGWTKKLLLLIWFTTGMILTRTAYRTGETAQRFYGHAYSSETLFGIFEFAVTWTAVALWAIAPAHDWIWAHVDTMTHGKRAEAV